MGNRIPKEHEPGAPEGLVRRMPREAHGDRRHVDVQIYTLVKLEELRRHEVQRKGEIELKRQKMLNKKDTNFFGILDENNEFPGPLLAGPMDDVMKTFGCGAKLEGHMADQDEDDEENGDEQPLSDSLEDMKAKQRRISARLSAGGWHNPMSLVEVAKSKEINENGTGDEIDDIADDNNLDDGEHNDMGQGNSEGSKKVEHEALPTMEEKSELKEGLLADTPVVETLPEPTDPGNLSLGGDVSVTNLSSLSPDSEPLHSNDHVKQTAGATEKAAASVQGEIVPPPRSSHIA